MLLSGDVTALSMVSESYCAVVDRICREPLQWCMARPALHAMEINEWSPEITKTRFSIQLSSKSHRKAVDPDGIHIKTLELTASKEGLSLNLSMALFDAIYWTSKTVCCNLLIQCLIKVNFCTTLPQKTIMSKCNDCFMITLISRVLKVFLHVCTPGHTENASIKLTTLNATSEMEWEHRRPFLR